jgi:hypothetical protein
MQNADPANCGGRAEQLFLPELSEDAAAGEKWPKDETGSAARCV